LSLSFDGVETIEDGEGGRREERGERDEKLLFLYDNGDFVFGWWESEGKGEGWFIHGVLVGKGRRTGKEGRAKQGRREERWTLFLLKYYVGNLQ
jgi:hypothetical protein